MDMNAAQYKKCIIRMLDGISKTTVLSCIYYFILHISGESKSVSADGFGPTERKFSQNSEQVH